MKIDIQVAGWRLYLDLSQPKPSEPADPTKSPPTQLSTPMRIGPGFVPTKRSVRTTANAESESPDA
jgi:hypothetical protein